MTAFNDGCIAIRRGHFGQRTIVVTGIGRSGTTAMIRSLYKMGLPKTGKLTAATNDDHDIGKAIVNRAGDLKERIDRRNAAHDVWGFKWHLLWQRHRELRMLRNPVLIVMSRDSVSIAKRAWHSDKSVPVTRWIEQVEDWQRELYRFALREAQMPVALVSFEKLVMKPATVLRFVSDFVSLPFGGVDEINYEDHRYVDGQHTARFEK
tara:strand:- start:904 stop:1524 length:621 start_codon:yes stop_codon:yes gene_type:complete